MEIEFESSFLERLERKASVLVFRMESLEQEGYGDDAVETEDILILEATRFLFCLVRIVNKMKRGSKEKKRFRSLERNLQELMERHLNTCLFPHRV